VGTTLVELRCPLGLGQHDCATEETNQTLVGLIVAVAIFRKEGSTYRTGFSIKLRNELAGTNVTLFTGKAKVEKSHRMNPGHSRESLGLLY
jgi:hypothetical protein